MLPICFGRLSDAAVVFAYSSTWPSEGDQLSEFSVTCGTCLRVGTRVVTTDRKLCSVVSIEEKEREGREGKEAERGGKRGGGDVTIEVFFAPWCPCGVLMNG